MSFLEQALSYARQGWRVFPLHSPRGDRCSCGDASCSSPAKHPRTPNGVKDATAQGAPIRAWWQKWPDANIGLATGEGSGVWVLDLDDPDLIDQLLTRVPLPPTRTAVTGRGLHLYYKWAAGVRNRARLLGLAGVDVRGEGGYVVAPPSVHASGKRYTWDPEEPDALAEASVALLGVVRDEPKSAPPPRKDPAPRDRDGLSAYQRGAIEKGCEAIRRAPSGSRNDTLNKEAFSLAGLGIDPHLLRQELGAAARDVGLGDKEIEKTLSSALPRGEAEPRPEPPPKSRPNGKAAIAEESPKAPPAKTYDISSLVSLAIPAREELLAPWLRQKDLVELYAWRGSGKTWVALSLAFAVAQGSSFWRWKAPKPRGVLYVDGELPAAVLQSRARALLRGQPAPKAPLLFLSADLQETGIGDLSRPENQAKVEQALAEGVELLVLDNLSCLFPLVKENEADGWALAQEWLLSLRRKGLSVIFLHHAGKGGAQRGTSKKEDVLDTVIALRRPEDYDPTEGARVSVHFEKARSLHGQGVEPFEAGLTNDPENGLSWTLREVESLEERILTLAREKFSQRVIAQEVGVGLATVCRVLKRAKEAGSL